MRALATIVLAPLVVLLVAAGPARADIAVPNYRVRPVQPANEPCTEGAFQEEGEVCSRCAVADPSCAERLRQQGWQERCRSGGGATPYALLCISREDRDRAQAPPAPPPAPVEPPAPAPVAPAPVAPAPAPAAPPAEASGGCVVASGAAGLSPLAGLAGLALAALVSRRRRARRG